MMAILHRGAPRRSSTDPGRSVLSNRGTGDRCAWRYGLEGTAGACHGRRVPTDPTIPKRSAGISPVNGRASRSSAIAWRRATAPGRTGLPLATTLLFAFLLGSTIALTEATAQPTGDPAQLGPIDQRLMPVWAEANLAPAPRCDDATFVRRVSLDLIGRGPTLAETEAFLAEPNREALVDRLLASPDFAAHWAELWAGHLFGDDRSTERLTIQMWLEESFERREPFDRLVTELIAAEGESAFEAPVNFLLARGDEPAIPVSRLFLGVRLDCARCHDHPFDRWTQEDFREFSRFFEGLERSEVSPGNTRLSEPTRSGDEPAPRFLTGAQPKTGRWRAELAYFLTRSKPFARNFANRIWYHLFGIGIVDPPDDVHAENPAIAPELLEWLATEARRTEFDPRHLIRLICASRAYQARTADPNDPHAADARRRFAARSIKPLTAEQWYDSMTVALDTTSRLDERVEFARQFRGEMDGSRLGATWEYSETLGGLLERLAADTSPPTDDHEELFLRLLARRPTDEERERFRRRSAGDVVFVLLHSHEFSFVP